jgi:hypothetical protein
MKQKGLAERRKREKTYRKIAEVPRAGSLQGLVVNGLFLWNDAFLSINHEEDEK